MRGATCALGYAAIQIAKAIGCKVIATTHKAEKLPLLQNADKAELDTERLAGKFKGVTKALELVGPKTLADTLRLVEKGGIVCDSGILGGVYALNGFDPIKDIPNGVYLTGFFSNDPTKKAMTDIFAFLDRHGIKPGVGAEYDFSHIKDACCALDDSSVNGKIVVRVS